MSVIHSDLEKRQGGLSIVPAGEKSLMDYAPIVGEESIAEIEALAAPLRGARVVHVSATAYGGGVAEILRTLVPLMRSAGLEAEWRVMTGSEGFFTQTKQMHNALQGLELPLTPELETLYLQTNVENAASLSEGYDFVVVHDPQPAPLRVLRAGDGGRWIWRCHLDLTAANPTYWHFLRPFVREYDAVIFTLPTYIQPDLDQSKVVIIPPAIDPLSPKNAPMAHEQVATLVARRGVAPSRPLLVQVSRFDPWKDPTGVIDVYRRAREAFPQLQLVLLGAMAHDDPEGLGYYQRTKEYAGGEADIHVLTNLGGDPEVNAFQRHATVLLQKSLREGFGLTVTEGLWKARPVVASNVGGIPLQIQDGVTGFLVESTEACAARVCEILDAPEAAAQMGMRGRELVRQRFVSTANLRHYLQLFNEQVRATVANPSQ